MTIKLKNTEFNKEIVVPTGFSWTSLCFGFFVPLFRSNYKQAAIWFAVAIVSGGFSTVIMPFVINKLCIKDLIAEGYEPVTSDDVTQLKQLEISVKRAA